MIFLLELLFRGTILVGGAIVIAQLAGRRRRAARAALLTVALTSMAALPLLVVAGPRVTVPILPPRLATVPSGVETDELVPPTLSPDPARGRPTELTEAAPGPVAPVVPRPIPGVLFGYLAVLVLIAVRKAVATRRAHQVIARASRRPPEVLTRLAAAAAKDLGITGVPDLRISADVSLPFVAGLVRPTVVFPPESSRWTEERLRLVLLHELAHVRRHDLVALAIADLACAVNWFNPLVWIATRQLRIEAEVASDDLVIESGVSAERYATILLRLARLHNGSPLLRPSPGVGAGSGLRERVRWILDDRPRGQPQGLSAVIAVGCLVAIGATVFQPMAAQSPLPIGSRSLNVSDGGPEISSNGAGLQARWSDGGRHAAMFLTGNVDLSGAGDGLVTGNGSVLLLEEEGDGLDVFEWRSESPGELPVGVRRTLAIGAGQLARLMGRHPKGLPGSTLTGLPAVSDDPTAKIVQAGWLAGKHRYGLALRGLWRVEGGQLTTGDVRAWFVGYRFDPRSGESRRLQISRGSDGALMARFFRDGVEAPLDRDGWAWGADALRALQRMAPDYAGGG